MNLLNYDYNRYKVKFQEASFNEGSLETNTFSIYLPSFTFADIFFSFPIEAEGCYNSFIGIQTVVQSDNFLFLLNIKIYLFFKCEKLIFLYFNIFPLDLQIYFQSTNEKLRISMQIFLFICLFVCTFFKTGFLYVFLEFSLHSRLASNSEIWLSLPPEYKDLEVCATTTHPSL